MNLTFPHKKKMIFLLSLTCCFFLAGLLTTSYAGDGMKVEKGMKMSKDTGKSTTRPGKEPDCKKFKYLTCELWKEINQAIQERQPPGPGEPDPGGEQTWPCESDFWDPNQCDFWYEGVRGCDGGGMGTMCVTENSQCKCKSVP